VLFLRRRKVALHDDGVLATLPSVDVPVVDEDVAYLFVQIPAFDIRRRHHKGSLSRFMCLQVIRCDSFIALACVGDLR
jgi:hypothetical protein